MFNIGSLSLFIAGDLSSMTGSEIILSEASSTGTSKFAYFAASSGDNMKVYYYPAGVTLDSVIGTGVLSGGEGLIQVEDSGSEIAAGRDGVIQSPVSYTRAWATVAANRFSLNRHLGFSQIAGGVWSFSKIAICPQLTEEQRLIVEAFMMGGGGGGANPNLYNMGLGVNIGIGF